MTRAPAARGGRPSLLAVFAHPDDESLACGGLLALCAEAEVRTSLLCLTRGEHGPTSGGERAGDADAGGPGSADADDPRRRGAASGAADALGEVRARELRHAARALGVEDVVLLEHEDGMLPWIEPARLERDVLEAIRRVEPDVLVTFDEDGLYWHPDHVAVHERVTAAVASLGASGPALYYVSVPAGAMRSVVEAAGAGATLLGVEDPDAFGAHAPPATLVVEAGALAARKLAALRCHRSQVEGGPLDALDEGLAARLLGREHYRRATIGRPGDTFVDALGASGADGRRGGPATTGATSVAEG